MKSMNEKRSKGSEENEKSIDLDFGFSDGFGACGVFIDTDGSDGRTNSGYKKSRNTGKLSYCGDLASRKR